MFGLEKGKEGAAGEEVGFELEEMLQDPKCFKKYQKRVDDRIATMKHLLRDGEEKDTFETLGEVFFGYLAFKRVIERTRHMIDTEKQ